MHVQLCIFVAAIVAALLTGGSRRRVVYMPHATVIKVIAYLDTGGWREAVWRILSTAASPQDVHVHVLVTCDDTTAMRALPHVNRSRVRTEFVPRGADMHPVAATQRLVKRLVNGDEAIVVVLHPDARLMDRWDARLRTLLLENAPEGGDAPPALLSCPPPTKDGRARFPTLRVRSTGAIARDTARAFELRDAEHNGIHPSVCWCAELTAAPPAALARAFQSASGRGYLAIAGPHGVPNVPLLEHDEALEDRVIDDDDGVQRTPLRRCERAGLTPRGGDLERIVKYGSTFAAKVALAATEKA